MDVSTKLAVNDGLKRRYANIIFDAVPLIGFFVIVVFFGVVTEGAIFTASNIRSILNQMFLYILGGFGCLFLFAQGGIDLSMAASIGLSAIIGARVMNVNLPLGVATTILVGVSVGVVMGVIYAYANIPIFIQGLAMNFLISGTLWPLCAGSSFVSTPLVIVNWLNSTREIIIVLVAFIIVTLTYNYTKFGKECRAIGAGETSSFQSGVNVQRAKIMAFVITGFTCGVVALLTLIRTSSASQSTGANFNFNVMLCLVLGGCVMGGGSGVKVRNAIIGAATLILLSNGLVIWGANSRIQDIVKGVLFILMIVATNKLSGKITE
jgi:ribose transport system permease protein